MAGFFRKILARVRNGIGFAKQRTPLVQCKRHCGVRKHRRHQSRRRASLNRPGVLEMAEKSARRASSESLSSEEINANLNRLDAEISERNPSMRILKKTWAALERLEKGKENLKEQIRTKAWEEYVARKRAMIEEEKEEIRFFNEVVIPRLANVLLDDQIEEEPVLRPVEAIEPN
ncbi:uncharacterized protein LOC119989705 isoform X2 [Tripterygium wilfordii]|uniref:uncharacterized protein LOC119989705 isoform X2 n=1 Tax=Tripterygium wilfordii TaxID=458696 RepID=UPI0018F86290|nr:uncharacterized protein LOC119989705 isoform X2 [Tripterygium wilfordii]